MSTQANIATPAASAPTTSNRAADIAFIVMSGISLALLLIVVFAPLPREVTGVLVVIATVTLVLGGLHVALAMILTGVVGLWALGGMRVVASTLEQAVYNPVASWQLSVIPLFVLMGIALWRSGVSGETFNVARQWIGGVPGGLASATNVAGAALASVSGSSIGVAYALGKAAIPEMMKSGYKASIATGVVAMSGVLGQIIPPSTMMIVYSGVTQTPVGSQLMAGLVPGLMLAAMFSVLITVRARLDPELAPRIKLEGVTRATRMRSLVGLLPIGLIFVTVVGGLGFGVMTATEAGAFGAAVALLLGLYFSRRESADYTAMGFLKDSFGATVRIVATIFFLIIALSILTRVMTLSRAADYLAGFIVDAGLGRVGFLLLLIPVLILLGMFLDTLAIMLITTPILLPTLGALDISLLWYGVYLVTLAELALVTPPIGMLSFIIYRLAQDPEVSAGRKVSLVSVFAGTTWFVGVTLIGVVLMIFFPQIVLWLPDALR